MIGVESVNVRVRIDKNLRMSHALERIASGA